MNLLQMKYALTIARTKSINKAADELYVGAPALSRAIKELETGLGVTLFDRSAKGMSLTPDGELFIRYAEKVLKEVNDIEAVFKDGTVAKQKFSIAVPRASYIAAAFAAFSNRVDPSGEVEMLYQETNAYRVINNVLNEDCRLGILRFSEQYILYYNAMMKEKGLIAELITEFRYVLVMSRKSTLAEKDQITYEDISGYTEIAHADPYVPSVPLAEVKKDEMPEHRGNSIFIFERGSQFELLSKNPDTYMWVSHIPQDLLDCYGLVEKTCVDNTLMYRDVLIYKQDYKLSALDKMFIEELVGMKHKVFAGR